MGFLENRIPPPVLFLLTAATMWTASYWLPTHNFFGDTRWGWTAFFVAVALIGPVAIMQFVRAQTTIDPVNIQNASNLVTGGAFSVTRNPMYVAMASLLIAMAIDLSSPWVWLGPAFFVLFIDRLQIAPEERAMSAKFGAEYDAYRARVRRWL